jgi:HK97 family phage portal protein
MLNRLMQTRSVSYQSIFSQGGDFATETQSGATINGNTAYEIVAFFAAVSLISDTISTLPVDAFKRIDGERSPYRPKPLWIEQPDVDTTRQAHYGAVVSSLLVYGNSYTRVFRDKRGDVVNLVALDPTKMEIRRSAIGKKIFIYADEPKPLTSDEVIHIIDLAVPGSLTGLSRVDKLKDALGVATALQSYAARFFSNGSSTNGIIEYPGELTAEEARDLRDGFDSRHRGLRKAHKTGVLSGGAKYVTTSVPNDQAQFLDSRRFAVEEVARAFNIPLHMLGIPDTASYASVEQNNLQFISHTLRPILEKLEWAYSRILPNGAFIKFNFSALLRGDLASRYQAYSIATQAGFKSINEIKKLEDEPLVEGGDVFRVPLANISIGAADLSETQIRVKMAETLVNAGYDPEAVLMELGLPEIPYVGTAAPEPMMAEDQSPGEVEDTEDDMVEDMTEEQDS